MDGTGDPAKEVMKRISTTIITLKKLDQFWLNSNCPIKRKVEVYDTVIKAKLLYGLESLQMRETVKRKLDTFQLYGLSKILRMKTTYVNRRKTNEKVMKNANDKLALERYHMNIEREEQGETKSKET